MLEFYGKIKRLPLVTTSKVVTKDRVWLSRIVFCYNVRILQEEKNKIILWALFKLYASRESIFFK